LVGRSEGRRVWREEGRVAPLVSSSKTASSVAARWSASSGGRKGSLMPGAGRGNSGRGGGGRRGEDGVEWI
jgi:hypothetical protein